MNDPSAIIAVLFAIIMIVSQIIKSIRENAEAAKRQQPDTDDDEVVIVRPTKPIKQQQKPPQQRHVAASQPSKGGLRSVFDEPMKEPTRKKALVKALAPQGEGHRFVADPGTLDTTNIIAPSIDPTVKADLGSMTGIYEQQSAAARAATRKTAPTVELNLFNILQRPEGICQAVILAEIMNRPAWIDTDR